MFDDKKGEIFKWLGQNVQNKVMFERKRGTYFMKMWVPVPAEGVKAKLTPETTGPSGQRQRSNPSDDDMDIDAVQVLTAEEWQAVKARRQQLGSAFTGQGR